MKNDLKKIPTAFNSISELHRALGLPKPMHPLVSLVDYGKITTGKEFLPSSLIFNFYKISYKKNLSGKVKYGQKYYDFDEGGLSFVSPNQLIAGQEGDGDYQGYTLLVHPDFLRNYSLGKTIKNFGFFAYAANEALHLSDKEKTIVISVFEAINDELSASIDDFSQDVLVSQIELLLNYSNRFYKRQFITRKAVSTDLLEELENILNGYFDQENSLVKGLPSVQQIADELNISPRYLSDMLRSLIGQNAQQLIHNKLIEKAKQVLLTSDLSVAQIAYMLGFEHPQSFSKIFKQKTKLTPLEFKQSFN